MTVRLRRSLCPTMAVAALLALPCVAQGRGNGGGTNGTAVIDQPIKLELTARDPLMAPLQPHQVHRSGSIRHDGGTLYRDGVDNVGLDAGDRRNLGLVFGRNSQRALILDLGDELPPLAGDGNGRITAAGPPLNFFAANGVPRPDWGEDGLFGTADDRLVTGSFRVAVQENVSALGALPMSEYAPIYCRTDLKDLFPVIDELDPIEVDPDDPLTFRQMSTYVRWEFEVNGHQWTLRFGRNTANRIPGSGFTHDDCGPVVVERLFATSSPDPYASDPPFEIRALPWQTTDPTHARYGLTVGYLYYQGTKKNDPEVYAGAFDIRWADGVSSRWSANPL